MFGLRKGGLGKLFFCAKRRLFPYNLLLDIWDKGLLIR